MFRTLLLLISLIGVPSISLEKNSFSYTSLPLTENLQSTKNLLEANYVPMNSISQPKKNILAEAALIIDPASAYVYYQKNHEKQLPIASLTKIMTAIIIMEENDVKEIAQIRFLPTKIEGKKMGLQYHEKISVENLLFGLLITSGNDAAVALAEHNAGTEKKFVVKMNERAKTLGLFNTHFKNPVGFDDNENYSSAYDLGMLSLYALKKPLFRKIIAIDSMEIASEDGIKHTIETTNQLLHNNFLNMYGVKTGTTDAAGECFIGLLKGPKGNELVTIVLGSHDRFQETKGLMQFFINNN